MHGYILTNEFQQTTQECWHIVNKTETSEKHNYWVFAQCWGKIHIDSSVQVKYSVHTWICQSNWWWTDSTYLTSTLSFRTWCTYCTDNRKGNDCTQVVIGQEPAVCSQCPHYSRQQTWRAERDRSYSCHSRQASRESEFSIQVEKHDLKRCRELNVGILATNSHSRMATEYVSISPHIKMANFTAQKNTSFPNLWQ